MAEITAQMVKELRVRTSAGMMDCKAALKDTAGDMDKAVDVLRKKGLKTVGKRAGKVAAQGRVHSYIHGDGRIGVLLELNTETDFVARGDDFTELAHALAMHIAWANPPYVSREEVPQAALDRETEIIKSQLKPGQEKVADKIVSGKLEKFYSENCLVDQLDARDTGSKKSMGDLINDVSAKVGEKVVMRRFSRFELGEGIAKEQMDFAEEVAAAAGA